MGFEVIDRPLPGLVVIAPDVHADARGYFMETYRRSEYARLGIDVDFVQDNQARSQRGTLRGLHFQVRHPQAKLVRVLRGRVFDVAVDLRPGSPTYGKWHGVILDSERMLQFFVPAGFAHGYLALTDDAEFAYKCSDYYAPGDEGGLLWNDPAVGIDWPLDGIGEPLLSPRDRLWPTLSGLEGTR